MDGNSKPVKNDLHHDLNDPNLFVRNQKGDYYYGNDDYGKIVRGNLELKSGERDPVEQRRVGGESRLPDDQGGHYIGTRFNGAPDSRNMDAVNGNLNQSSYKIMENQWANELKDGNKVFVHVEGHTGQESERPDVIYGYSIVEYKDGTRNFEQFSYTNVSGDEQAEWNEFLDGMDIEDDDLRTPEGYDPSEYDKELGGDYTLVKETIGSEIPRGAEDPQPDEVSADPETSGETAEKNEVFRAVKIEEGTTLYQISGVEERPYFIDENMLEACRDEETGLVDPDKLKEKLPVEDFDLDNLSEIRPYTLAPDSEVYAAEWSSSADGGGKEYYIPYSWKFKEDGVLEAGEPEPVKGKELEAEDQIEQNAKIGDGVGEKTDSTESVENAEMSGKTETAEMTTDLGDNVDEETDGTKSVENAEMSGKTETAEMTTDLGDDVDEETDGTKSVENAETSDKTETVETTADLGDDVDEETDSTGSVENAETVDNIEKNEVTADSNENEVDMKETYETNKTDARTDDLWQDSNDISDQAFGDNDIIRPDHSGSGIDAETHDKLWDELNSNLDAKEERASDREKFLEGFDSRDLENMDPEDAERMKAVNKLAIREELDDANGGETSWDKMSFEDKMSLHKTNPDRFNALLQDYQDRHPHGLDEDNPDFDKSQKDRNLTESKELRDNDKSIPDALAAEKNPYKDYVGVDNAERDTV